MGIRSAASIFFTVGAWNWRLLEHESSGYLQLQAQTLTSLDAPGSELHPVGQALSHGSSFKNLPSAGSNWFEIKGSRWGEATLVLVPQTTGLSYEEDLLGLCPGSSKSQEEKSRLGWAPWSLWGLGSLGFHPCSF